MSKLKETKSAIFLGMALSLIDNRLAHCIAWKCKMNSNAGSVETRAAPVLIRPGDSEVPEQVVPGQSDRKHADCLPEKKKSLQARYAYGIIFLVINLKAWFFRDYGQKLLVRFKYLKACGTGGQDCCHTLGVLRVSLGGFIFFFIMFASTMKTKKLYDVRNIWHSRWWLMKLFLLLVAMAIPFFFPAKYIELYGELARVGAGVFLVLQLVSIIEFIAWWNNYWMPDEERKRSGWLGLFMSTIFYICSVCGIGGMYFYHGLRLECSLNIFFITWTAVLLIVMMAISLHSKVNRGLLSSGIMASYLVFLCWSAIRSEPADDKCNKKLEANAHGTDWTTVLGFLIAVCAIVMATFSTGIDSQSFQFRKDKVKQEDDIPYDYGFFHLVFALGAMYFAMLFISWNLKDSARKWSIDVGWASTWVKIVNEWFAATIYLWRLISPVVRQDKVRNYEDSVRRTDETSLP